MTVSPILRSQNTTVIDVTYLCNASCKYCQWGDRLTAGRIHRPLREILIPAVTLCSLGTQRIVLSGGEPRLNPELEEVIRYYRGIVSDVIVITNGYGLDKTEVSKLVDAGATGITLSLDSLSPEVTSATRETAPTLHRKILCEIEEIAAVPRTFELGINCVVSHPTANWNNVRALLEWGFGLDVDFVKFQPVFDDGYVGRNAPELKLSCQDGPELLKISDYLDSISHPPTNPREFWKDLAELASGESLLPQACELGPRNSILTREKLNICYWLDSASFGDETDSLSVERVNAVRREFEKDKLRCKVGFHCFCNQDLGHKWKESSS